VIIGQHDQTHALSSVNGFAIHAEGTAGVSAVYPVEFNVKATSTVQAPLYELDIGYENCCVAVKRGAPIPKAITAVDRYNGENGSLFDAVIPDDEAQENILQRSDGQTVLRVPFRVIEGANVFRPQYDRRNGGVQITRGEFIQEDLTNAASLADSKIWVLKKPSVAIVFSWSAVTDRFSETRVRHPYLSDMTKLVTQLTSLKMLEGLGINFDIFFHPREAFIKTDLQREMNTHDIVVYIDYDHQNVSSPAGARAITALGGKICLRYYLGKFEKGALLGVGRNKQLAQIAVFWINGDNNAVNVAMRELVQPFIRAYLGRPARFLASMGDGRDPGCDETSSPSDKGLEEDNMGGKDSIGKNGTADAAEKYIAVDVMDR
jgi:molybdopterin biosynthesis enzyme